MAAQRDFGAELARMSGGGGTRMIRGGTGGDKLSPAELAAIRIRQIQYDMAQARKRGTDTSGDDYAAPRGELMRLRGVIKNSRGD